MAADQQEGMCFDAGGATWHALIPQFGFAADGVTSDSMKFDALVKQIAASGGGVLHFGVMGPDLKPHKDGRAYLLDVIQEKILPVHELTTPPNVTLSFAAGARLVIGNGLSLVVQGTVVAGLHQIFDIDWADPDHGTVRFSGGRMTEFHPQWWGARGDGSAHDDWPGIQAAVDAAASAASGSHAPCSVPLVPPKSAYRVSRSVEIGHDNIRLAGTAPGVMLANVALDVTAWKQPKRTFDVVRVGPKRSGAARNVVVENLWLRGNHVGSRCIAADGCEGMTVRNITTRQHKGQAASFKSCKQTNVEGCYFELGSGFLVEEEDCVGSRYVSVAFENGHVGLHLKRSTKVVVDACIFEHFTLEQAPQGSEPVTAILAESAGGPDGEVAAEKTLIVRGCYFEANDRMIVADEGYRVSIEGCNNDGGWMPAGGGKFEPRAAVESHGGGAAFGLQGGGGTLIKSRSGVFRAEHSTSLYGKMRELCIPGANTPFPPCSENAASLSWFDADPGWQTGGSVYGDAELFGGNRYSVTLAAKNPDPLKASEGPKPLDADSMSHDVPAGARDHLVFLFRAGDVGKGVKVVKVRQLFDGGTTGENNINVFPDHEWHVVLMADTSSSNNANALVTVSMQLEHPDFMKGSGFLKDLKLDFGAVAAAASGRIGIIRTSKTEDTVRLGPNEVAAGPSTFGGGQALKELLAGTAVLDFDAIPDQVTGTAKSPVIVDGVMPGDVVAVGIEPPLPIGTTIFAIVTKEKEVTISVLNRTGAGIGPFSGKVHLIAWRH